MSDKVYIHYSSPRYCPHCTKIGYEPIESDRPYAPYTYKIYYLVKRINKSTNDWFWGCPNFPTCRYSENRPLTQEEQDIKTWAWANSYAGPHY